MSRLQRVFSPDHQMNRTRLAVGVALMGLIAWGPSAWAQPVPPRIGYAYPAGGHQGARFQVVVGGQSLGGITNAWLSGGQARIAVVDYSRPLTPKEFNDLREKLKELQDRRPTARSGRAADDRGARPGGTNVWTAADEALLAEIRKKLANPPNRQASPAIAERVTLELTLAADAEAGERELRLKTTNGLSNPLVFHVGRYPEFSRPPAHPLPVTRFNPGARANPVPAVLEIKLPAIINGQIMPGTADRYRFSASRGQRLVVAVSARALIPYLPDAVPGWFQAIVALYDAHGKELACVDDNRFDPDPVLYYEVPETGEYQLEIRDAIFRGREDFVYRIVVGELPYLRSHYPLGGPAEASTPVELLGWNLTVTQGKQPARSPGVYPLVLPQSDVISPAPRFLVDAGPDLLEREPNQPAAVAQSVTLPVTIHGRIHTPGDVDLYSFTGHAGDHVVAEVLARRLNSPLDSTLRLLNAEGKLVAFNDDYMDKGAGLTTHQADSRLDVCLPANGAYQLEVADAQRQGGEEYAYRLRLGPPQPDFELRVVPSSLNVRPGASQPFTVYALRKDGFTNEIRLALRRAPAGFSLEGARVPAAQDQVRLTLTAPPAVFPAPVPLTLEGRAMIGGRETVRTAVPAEDMMQAFAYRHLVPAKELLACVVGRTRPGPALRLVGGVPVRIPAQGTALVRFNAPARGLVERARLELSDPPEGISLEKVSATGLGLELVFRADPAKVKPGMQGNLIVQAYAGGRPLAGRPQTMARRLPLTSLPAIPFEVLPP